MRDSLTPYKGAESLNYLCAVMTELLGEYSLARAPALLSGFTSVTSTLPRPAAIAIANLRIAGHAPSTIRALKLSISRYHDHFRQQDRRRTNGRTADPARSPRYVIADDLSIRKTWTDFRPADIDEALSSLATPLPVMISDRLPPHDPTKQAEASVETKNYSGVVQPLCFSPPDSEEYDLGREQRAIGTITWDEIRLMADDFDRTDVINGRQVEGRRSWHHRLYDSNGAPRAELVEASANGLEISNGIDLSGLKHLIGLPGAGKTTLLYLIAAILARRGHRACFLYPSIEVASAFVETLSMYGIRTALLFGQGDRARSRHVLNFAASFSNQNNGFGVTRAVAPLFATNCSLAGFTSDEETSFPHSQPPCLTITQKPSDGRRSSKHRCALTGVCGRQQSERELIDSPIWVGHILSIDRNLSPLFSSAKLRHFEYIARTFDLLVIDECDGAQSDLDRRGTPMMKLVGDDGALARTLYMDVHGRASGASNSFISDRDLSSIMEMTGRFGTACTRLAAFIAQSEKTFKKHAANMLHTSGSLISDMYPAPKGNSAESAYLRIREAFERIWDLAAKNVAFRSARERQDADEDAQEDQDLDHDLQTAADAAGVTLQVMRTFYESLSTLLEQWDRDGDEEVMTDLVALLKQVPGLPTSIPEPMFISYANLLVNVSLLVLQHFGLAPHLRLMNSEGIVSDEVFESRPSRDVMSLIPDALVGRLSGIRYTVSDDGDVDISHVSFDGTPRLLPDRMHRLSMEGGGPGLSVLFTSATSLLEESPSFHVDIGPHYVLRRPNAGSGWADSRYRFMPLRDPLDSGAFLRFSGQRFTHRDRSLCAMVDELLKHGQLSHISSAMSANDVINGVGRKCGLVVNSYDQCQLLFDHIQKNHPNWAKKTRYLVRANLIGTPHAGGVTAAEVERLGIDPDWDLLIFPMNAIGRGVNIVYQFGPRMNQAMLGNLFFLTRPHPRADSLQLMQGLVGRASANFDGNNFADTRTSIDAMLAHRREMSASLRKLFRLPLASQALHEFAPPFVADLMIIIIQTIGRAMRGDCPAFVYFVDSAWAPSSAVDNTDTARTSMLVMMQKILRDCLNHRDPVRRECYENLYRPFFEPLSNITGLLK